MRIVLSSGSWGKSSGALVHVCKQPAYMFKHLVNEFEYQVCDFSQPLHELIKIKEDYWLRPYGARFAMATSFMGFFTLYF